MCRGLEHCDRALSALQTYAQIVPQVRVPTFWTLVPFASKTFYQIGGIRHDDYVPRRSGYYKQ
eukprot:12126230-Karenia_brevis.AAC.1